MHTGGRQSIPRQHGCQCFTVLNNMAKSLAHGMPAAWDSHRCCSCCDMIDAIAKWNDSLAKAFSKILDCKKVPISRLILTNETHLDRDSLTFLIGRKFWPAVN